MKKGNQLMLKVHLNNESIRVGIVSERRIKPGRIEIEMRFKGNLFKVVKDRKYGIQHKEGPFVLAKEILDVIDNAMSDRYNSTINQ